MRTEINTEVYTQYKNHVFKRKSETEIQKSSVYWYLAGTLFSLLICKVTTYLLRRLCVTQSLDLTRNLTELVSNEYTCFCTFNKAEKGIGSTLKKLLYMDYSRVPEDRDRKSCDDKWLNKFDHIWCAFSAH